jgi:acetylornithine deacetylase/succinyl-diaminopimelate desuccinylase-like protein
MRRIALATALALGIAMPSSTVWTEESPDLGVSALTQQPGIKAALAAAKAREPETIATQIRLTEIPAPSFAEGSRGDEMRRLFQQVGLRNIRKDKAGNILADRPGAALHPHVVIAAHLDTVFPEGTSVKVRRDGAVLYAPGIGDDARGLSLLVAIARSLNEANVSTRGSVTFVADVGEEGLGDLRGIKAIFDDTLKGTVDRFVTIDGTGNGLAHTFVGSRRYRVTVKGPGGHSFADFGVPSPIGALGRAVAKIQDLRVPPGGQTTFNVGRIGGGTSVNSIPAEAWMEVDLRSSDRRALAALDADFQKAVDSALAAEHPQWRQARILTMTKELVGNRPVSATPADAAIVQAATSATRAVGAEATTTISSSDANYPATLGIPSVQIGGGGSGANAHAPTESFDTTDSWRGTQRALLLTIALAGK